MPAAPAAYTEEEARIPGPPPALAADGPKSRVDLDALEVEGVALAEDLPEEPPLYEPKPMDDMPPANDAVDAEETSPVAVRGPGWSSAMAALPTTPAMPTGLGGSDVLSPKRSPAAGADAEEARPPKQAKATPAKKPRVGQIAVEETWQAIEAWANAEESQNPHALQRLASVCTWLDSISDPMQVAEARLAQLRKLWQRSAFEPVHKRDVPPGSEIFHFKWVDKCKEGVYKSRFTCADVKRNYSEAEEEQLRVFVPTPTPESHRFLEVSALFHSHATTFNIVAAFLIGRNRGAQEGNPCYMRAPEEWRPIFEEWVRDTFPPHEVARRLKSFPAYMFRLDGNLYGRRTAGSVYRDEFEEILVEKMKPTFCFVRGKHDPCTYHCSSSSSSSKVTLIHHVDDVRCSGPASALNRLIDVELPKHCEIQAGPLEAEGVAVEVLGRVKTRLEGAILTAPDPKHAKNILTALDIQPKEKSAVPSRKLNLDENEPLADEFAKRYRSAVGSGIYLSADRRDIAYAVKELARHMAQPRLCDWENALVMGRYLNSHPDLVRATVLDGDAHQHLALELYSDSDWAGCPETRRSTDAHVGYLGGAVITASTQTQPGLPATSSPDAELRGISRSAREAIFLKGLASDDFQLPVEVPLLWSDSSTGITAAKRIGPGSKLRHLDVCEFYVQGAVQTGRLQLRKVKGTMNPSNYLTKHPKTGSEVQEALPSLGLVNVHEVEGATAARKGTVKALKENPPAQWKTMAPMTKASVKLCGALAASQITGVKGHKDGSEGCSYLPWILGIMVLLGCVVWMCMYNAIRLRRAQVAREPAPEPDTDPGRSERATPPFRQGQRRPPADTPAPMQRVFRHDRSVFFTRTGSRAHMYSNCQGLQHVPEAEIDEEMICQTCYDRHPIGNFWLHLERIHLVCQIPWREIHLLLDCPELARRTTWHMPVCQYSRRQQIMPMGHRRPVREPPLNLERGAPPGRRHTVARAGSTAG